MPVTVATPPHRSRLTACSDSGSRTPSRCSGSSSRTSSHLTVCLHGLAQLEERGADTRLGGTERYAFQLGHLRAGLTAEVREFQGGPLPIGEAAHGRAGPLHEVPRSRHLVRARLLVRIVPR